MTEFLKELRRFESSPEILKDCAKRINEYLALPIELKEQQVVLQKQFLNELGNNGLDETVRIINDFLRSKGKTV